MTVHKSEKLFVLEFVQSKANVFMSAVSEVITKIKDRISPRKVAMPVIFIATVATISFLPSHKVAAQMASVSPLVVTEVMTSTASVEVAPTVYKMENVVVTKESNGAYRFTFSRGFPSDIANELMISGAFKYRVDSVEGILLEDGVARLLQSVSVGTPGETQVTVSYEPTLVLPLGAKLTLITHPAVELATSLGNEMFREGIRPEVEAPEQKTVTYEFEGIKYFFPILMR